MGHKPVLNVLIFHSWRRSKTKHKKSYLEILFMKRERPLFTCIFIKPFIFQRECRYLAIIVIVGPKRFVDVRGRITQLYKPATQCKIECFDGLPVTFASFKPWRKLLLCQKHPDLPALTMLNSSHVEGAKWKFCLYTAAQTALSVEIYLTIEKPFSAAHDSKTTSDVRHWPVAWDG